jgi:hypothetical protein
VKWIAEPQGKAIVNETIVDAAALLLSYGLDPNEPNAKGHTFWTEFLEHIYVGKPAKPTTVLTLLQILTLFLRYGADPTVFHCSITDNDFCLWPKIICAEGARCLCVTDRFEQEDEINKFIELIEQEKILAGNRLPYGYPLCHRHMHPFYPTEP